jgi:hypothetical protein
VRALLIRRSRSCWAAKAFESRTRAFVRNLLNHAWPSNVRERTHDARCKAYACAPFRPGSGRGYMSQIPMATVQKITAHASIIKAEGSHTFKAVMSRFYDVQIPRTYRSQPLCLLGLRETGCLLPVHCGIAHETQILTCIRVFRSIIT